MAARQTQIHLVVAVEIDVDVDVVVFKTLFQLLRQQRKLLDAVGKGELLIGQFAAEFVMVKQSRNEGFFGRRERLICIASESHCHPSVIAEW
ncbi:hypothetical protein PRK78_004724 [Emydomyces testavorans]|uniref:Uncharacterized protein n=1 Tax=Emydomyces testavorans TaxID=2070801 RepID=A0AAF0DM19_9EURO|nr:hypothetical protein PRK78_004724 [Emydomyces testavorans]